MSNTPWTRVRPNRRIFVTRVCRRYVLVDTVDLAARLYQSDFVRMVRICDEIVRAVNQLPLARPLAVESKDGPVSWGGGRRRDPAGFQLHVKQTATEHEQRAAEGGVLIRIGTGRACAPPEGKKTDGNWLAASSATEDRIALSEGSAVFQKTKKITHRS